MLKAFVPGREFDFKTRNRRPPRDPVNALLSFAYAMLLKDCFSALCTVGFDPYFGFYHASRHGKPSAEGFCCLRTAQGDNRNAPGVRVQDGLWADVEVQARMLAAHVRGDIAQYTGFTIR